jgi:uncharacterized protein (TIGR03067 family)
MLRVLSFMVVATFLGMSQMAFAAPPAGDLTLMEGTWKVKYGEKGNKPLTTDQLRVMSIRITGPLFAILINGKVETVGHLVLDSTKDPKQLKMESPDGEKAALGIYKFEMDELRFCWDNSPGKRPATFSGVNEKGSLVYLRLVKATP